MELRILIFTLSTAMLLHRGLVRAYKTFNFMALLCIFFCLAAYGLCPTNGMQSSPECDACASSGKSCNLGFSDTGLGCVSPPMDNRFGNVCPNTHSFCFPSTLSGCNQKEKTVKATSSDGSGSQCNGLFCAGLAQDGKVISNTSFSSSDHGIFKLLNGGVASCSLNYIDGVNNVPSHQTEGCCKNDIPFRGDSLHKQKTTHSWSKNSEMSKSSSFDGSFTPNVRINPTVLDWGQQYLYSPSVAFLTMVNTCNDSTLHLYEPFSNDSQFYPCNFSEVSLGPGESAVICFVFFPRWLGSSSADLILQTSSGGLIVEAKGHAIESPFGTKPIFGLKISPGGSLRKTFSLLNPFDETIHVVEITTWISISLGHSSVETEAICGVNNFQGFDNLLSSMIKDRLVVKSSQAGSATIAIKPHMNWEIGPNSSETVMEIDITVGFEGKLSGAFCLHLMRSSQDKTDTIIFPIEAETDIQSGSVVRSMGLPPNVKVTEIADVDELVLENWVSQGTTNDMSVLENHEVQFPVVQVGSHVSRWISVKNPSHHPVMMQLILNSGEIIDQCRNPDDKLHLFSSGNLVIDEAISRAKYGFSIPENAVTEAYVHPYDNATLGPINFYPSRRCGWNGSALIRNNISGVEWIPLRGFGGLLSLVLLERSEHVQSINFDLKMHNLLNFSLPHALLRMKQLSAACLQPLVKELFAKNTGDLPLEVKKMRVSGRECGLDGFKIHDCRGFTLEPGESIKLLISYQTYFSAAVVQRDLELALASGIILIPMKASVSYDVLCNCKKSVFWMRVKKWLLGFLLAASLISLASCFIYPQIITHGSLDYLCKNDDDSIHITLKCAGKTPLLPCNQRKSKLAVSGRMNNLFCSVGKGTTSTMRTTCVRYSYDLSEPSDQKISQHLMQDSENHQQKTHLLDTQTEKQFPSTAVQNSDTKASQLGEIMTKVGKEKSRRRKKKNPGATLSVKSEASSSRSGNSTPTSPLSPMVPALTKCSWPLSPNVDQPSIQAHSLTTQKAAQHPKKCQAFTPTVKTNVLKPVVPMKSCSKGVSSPQVSQSVSSSNASIPVKIPSSTCPMLGGGPSPSFLVSTSTVTLSARAPGPKLEKQKAVLAPTAGVADKYTYDIWDAHLSGLHLLVPKDVTCMKSSPAEKNFDSFFVGGPQAIK